MSSSIKKLLYLRSRRKVVEIKAITKEFNVSEKKVKELIKVERRKIQDKIKIDPQFINMIDSRRNLDCTLEEVYSLKNILNEDDTILLAKKVGVSRTVITKWFYYRRQRKRFWQKRQKNRQ